MYQSLYNIETLSSRLSAQLEAQPIIRPLWHRMTALQEAASTLSLEMIGVQARDILHFDLNLSSPKSLPETIQTASKLYRFLLNPGSLYDDPAAILDRAYHITHIPDFSLQDGKISIHHRSQIDQHTWLETKSYFAHQTRQILDQAPSPVMGALAITKLAVDCFPEPSPISERLIFIAAEHSFRLQDQSSPFHSFNEGDYINPPLRATWVCAPSVALSHKGVRGWAVTNQSRIQLLLDKLDHSLTHNIGTLGLLKDWAETAYKEFSGKTSRSQKANLAKLLLTAPIIDARTVALSLSITEKSARSLLNDATQFGLLDVLTARRSYRLWAVPAFSAIIRARIAPKSAPLQPTNIDERPVAVPHSTYDNEYLDSLFTDVETAMSNAADVMNQYGRKS